LHLENGEKNETNKRNFKFIIVISVCNICD
jgi:hypothetical protein